MDRLTTAKALMHMNKILMKHNHRSKRIQIIRDHGYFSYKRLYKRLHREKLMELEKGAQKSEG